MIMMVIKMVIMMVIVMKILMVFENDDNGSDNDELPSLYLMPNWVIYFGQTLLNGTFSKKLLWLTKFKNCCEPGYGYFISIYIYMVILLVYIYMIHKNFYLT